MDSKCVYNTQGQLVNRTLTQKLSDAFLAFLPEHTQKTAMPVYNDYRVPCYLACNSKLKTDFVQNYTSPPQYFNK